MPLLYVSPAVVRGAEEFSEPHLLTELSGARTPSACLAAYRKLIQWYRFAKQNDKALDACQKALNEKFSRKDRYAIMILRGDIFLDDRRYSQAIESYQEAVALSPWDDTARLALASACEQSELNELAEQEYLTVLKRNRKSYIATFRLASLYLKEGLTTQAMEYYRRALTIKPEAEVYRRISACAEMTGNMDLALVVCRQIDAAQRTYDDYISLGHLYNELNNYNEAEQSFSQAIKLNPEKIEGYLFLGLLYLSHDNLTPAEKLIQIAAEQAPSEAFPHFVLGTIYGREGNVLSARKELAKARELSKTDMLRVYSEKYSRFLISHLK